MTVSLAVVARNLAMNAALDPLNSGKLRIYAGTPPANADAALSSNTLLADLTLNATAFAAASSGSKVANAITGDTSADASGTATFYRLLKSDLTVYEQGTVTATSGGGDIELATTTIVAGADVEITSFTLTFPA